MGSKTKLTAADEPSAERMTVEKPMPIAANAPAPSKSAKNSETGRSGNGVLFSSLPRTNSAAHCNRKTTRIDVKTALR